MNEAWIEFCEARLGKTRHEMQFVDVFAELALELLFEWNPMFADRTEAIAAVSYDAAFDRDADRALEQMAREDSLRGWQTLSLGAWRVLLERHAYACLVASINIAHPENSLAALPLGLTKQQAARALGLYLLLGSARAIDRRLLATMKPGELPGLPPGTALRTQ